MQLGMNAGTASHRLVRDILFKFILDAGHTCYRCKGILTREDFSIEHKEPWLDSSDPVKLFFDLNNIAFSHKSCNYATVRKVQKNYAHGPYRYAPKGKSWCRGCKDFLLVEKFGNYEPSPNGLYYECKNCTNKNKKIVREKSKLAGEMASR